MNAQTLNRSFVRVLVRNRKFLTTSCTAFSQYFPSAGCRHPFPEAMLVLSFPVRRLKCPLHLSDIYYGDNQFNSNFPVSKNGSTKVKNYFVKTDHKSLKIENFLYFYFDAGRMVNMYPNVIKNFTVFKTFDGKSRIMWI